MKKSVLVIGAGLAGLSTACNLAQTGWSVVLVEKNKDVGGRARVFRKKGYTFDMGPSWYMMPEVFDGFFEKFDKKTSDYYELVRLDPRFKVFFEDGSRVVLNDDLEQNKKIFEEVEKGAGERLEKLVGVTDWLYQLTIDKLLSKNYGGFLDLIKPEMVVSFLMILAKMNPFESYEKMVSGYFENEKLKHLVEHGTVFLGGSPHNTPAIYSMMIAADYVRGVYYPDGGMGKVVDAFRRLAIELGVEIRTEEEVVGIESNDGKVVKVVTNKNEYNPSVVVSGADYAHTELDLIENEDRSYGQKYWDKRVMGISTLLLYVGVKKKLPSLEHHNFYYSTDWDDHFESIFDAKKWPKNPSYYVCAPSKTDESVAPAGSENLFVLVPLASGLDDDGRDEFVKMILSKMEKDLDCKFVDDIEVCEVYSQRDYLKDYNAFGGTALGMAHTLLQSVVMRPKMRSKKLKNLYYTGQYTQPGVGVPMVVLSGKYVAEEINSA